MIAFLPHSFKNVTSPFQYLLIQPNLLACIVNKRVIFYCILTKTQKLGRIDRG